MPDLHCMGVVRYIRLRYTVRFFRHHRWLRRMCLHCIRLSCDFCTNSRGTGQDKSYGGCTVIARKSFNFNAVIAKSPQAFYGNRKEPERHPCRGSTIFFCNIATENRKLAARTSIARPPNDLRAVIV